VCGKYTVSIVLIPLLVVVGGGGIGSEFGLLWQLQDLVRLLLMTAAISAALVAANT